MKERTFIALGLLVAACASFASSSHKESTPTVAGLWVRLDSEWKDAPPELGYSESTIRARLLRFHDDGQMSLLLCLLRRNKVDTGLSPADGYVLYRGSWRSEGGKLVAHYVKAEEMIPSSDPPFATFHEATVSLGAQTLVFGDVEFSQNDLISLADYDAFVKRIPLASPRLQNEDRGRESAGGPSPTSGRRSHLAPPTSDLNQI